MALKAPLADPTFTGVPAAPTASDAATNTTQIATTAFVQSVSGGKVADEIKDKITAVAPSQNAVFDGLALKAPLADPTFTGIPAAPTAASGTNTTQIATTAFVQSAAPAKGGYREGAFLYAGADGVLKSLKGGGAGQALVMNSDGKAPEWKAATGGVAKDGYREGAFLYAGADGVLTSLNAGTAGQALVMNSSGKAPEWKAAVAAPAKGGYREGAFLYAGSDGVLTSLNKGTAGQALVMNSDGKAPEWKDAAGGVAKDGYKAGDFLYADDTRDKKLIALPAGRAGTVLTMNSDGKAPEWKDAVGGVAKDGYREGAFLYAGADGVLKSLDAGTAGQALMMNSGGKAPEWKAPVDMSGYIAKTGYVAGDLLYRGEREVIALSKGTPGQVLMMDDRSPVPKWSSDVVAKGGYKAGDILYATDRDKELTALAAGTAGQVLMMKDATTPEWSSAIKTYSIGDFVHGGIVFWVDETGQHGLVCAKKDQSAMRWFGGKNGHTRAKGDGVYAGKANTAIIIAATVSIGDDNATYAARACNELQLEEERVPKYGDWYLPSNHELNLMFLKKAEINTTAGRQSGSSLSSAYWSSTEIDNDGAYKVNMSDGKGAEASKGSTSNVRAVRTF